MMRVEVDDDEDGIRLILCLLAVAQKLIVADGVEAQAPVVVQGWVVMADAVDAGDKIFEVVRSSIIPDSNLVFFGVQILFAAGLAGAILAELEGRTVDTIARPERRR